LKAEYADFLEKSNLDVTRPQADLQVTAPGKYWILEAQIEAHRYLVSGGQIEQASFQEAAVFWHDGVYQSMAQGIRDRGLLQEFTGRTEADLYLWIFEHRSQLRQDLAWDIAPHELLTKLAVQHRPRTLTLEGLTENQVRNRKFPTFRRPRALTGQWRREKMVMPEQSRLFFNILVAITGQAEGWQALEQAFEIARREHGKILGLHLVSSTGDLDGPIARSLHEEFDRRCQAANIAGRLTIEAGPAVDMICHRAGLADLVVAPLLNPPGSRLLGRISSEFRILIQRCARPVLAVPEKPSYFTRLLLAYDGNSKAKEALYVAAYLTGRWHVPLVVLTVAEENSNQNALQTEAKNYLEQRNVPALFVEQTGAAAAKILETAEDHEADLIIMGGYGHSKLKDLVLGSSVDQVLRESDRAMLICR
jgi:nucleotide-binding universal stress UspA family protein